MRHFIPTIIISLLALAASARADAQSATQPSTQPAKIVALDYFYNHQVKDGKQFAYVWEDAGPLGYSQFGEIWEKAGATLGRMDKAPTQQDLDRASVYIIASPSNEENAADHKPNYIQGDAIPTIVSWVKDGGVLAIFANSRDKCDIAHLNDLARSFGVVFHDGPFSSVPKPAGMVTYDGKQVAANAERTWYSAGSRLPGDGWRDTKDLPDLPVFKGAAGIYANDYSDIYPEAANVKFLLIVHHGVRFKQVVHLGDTWMPFVASHPMTADGMDTSSSAVLASINIGRGMVVLVGCPWFENQSLDYSSLAVVNDNHAVAENFVQWLLAI
jgi:hypothetical protein